MKITYIADVPLPTNFLPVPVKVGTNYQKQFGGMAYHLAMMIRYLYNSGKEYIDHLDYIFSSNDFENVGLDGLNITALPSIELRSRPWDKTWTENIVDEEKLNNIIEDKLQKGHKLVTSTIFGFNNYLYGKYPLDLEYRVDHRVLTLGDKKAILEMCGVKEKIADLVKVEEILIDYLFENYISKASRIFVYNSRNYEDFVKRGYPKERLIRMLLPVDSTKEEMNTVLSEELKLNYLPGKTFGYVGRVSEDKNMDQLAGIWIEINKLWPDAQLIVAGDGAELNNLKQKLQNTNVTFLGQIPHDQVFSLAREMLDYVIVPDSIIDTFNRSAVEVMTQGTTMITSRNSVVAGNFKNYCITYDPMDYKMAAEEIINKAGKFHKGQFKNTIKNLVDPAQIYAKQFN